MLSPPLAKVTAATLYAWGEMKLLNQESCAGVSSFSASFSSSEFTKRLMPIAMGTNPNNPIQGRGNNKLPKKLGRLAPTRAAKPRYCPATMWRLRKMALTWEKNNIRIKMSSRLVAVKAVKPVEIAVISPFMSVDDLNSVLPKVRAFG